jgi:glycosyltransferase involved in cell wall biosynthesis
MHVLIPALHRPTQPTGVCRHAVNLAQCLAATERVSQTTLLIGEWQRDYFERSFSLDPNIQLVTVDIKNSSLSRNQWFMLGLPKLAQQLQPDIIHLSFPFPFVRQWFKAPVIATIHDLYPFECPENFGYPQVWFNQLFLRQCLDNSDGLTCVSQCTLDSLQAYFPKRHPKTTVVYNVVEFADTPSKFPQQLGRNFNDPFLISVAQHRKNKNLDLLIQAYSALLKAGQLQPHTRLLLVGSSGPETENLTQLVQALDLDNEVMFLSAIEDGELRWLYEQADVFVIPSSTEGFCLPLVEALALGCAAVCSDIPIFREVGALQCQYFELNPQALPNLIQAILAALSDSASTATDARFSKQAISQQLLNFYALF